MYMKGYGEMPKLWTYGGLLQGDAGVFPTSSFVYRFMILSPLTAEKRGRGVNYFVHCTSFPSPFDSIRPKLRDTDVYLATTTIVREMQTRLASQQLIRIRALQIRALRNLSDLLRHESSLVVRGYQGRVDCACWSFGGRVCGSRATRIHRQSRTARLHQSRLGHLPRMRRVLRGLGEPTLGFCDEPKVV